MNIYVGNLSPRTSVSQLRKAFEMYGTVDIVSLDARPRDDDAYGFCFVSMPLADQASRAIEQLHGQMPSGNSLTVRESGLAF